MANHCLKRKNDKTPAPKKIIKQMEIRGLISPKKRSNGVLSKKYSIAVNTAITTDSTPNIRNCRSFANMYLIFAAGDNFFSTETRSRLMKTILSIAIVDGIYRKKAGNCYGTAAFSFNH